MAFETEFDLSLEGLDEAEEAVRPVRKPSSQSSFRPRPTGGASNVVTQTQLEAALARVDKKISTVAEGISTINARLASVTNLAKKEVVSRKKAEDSQGKDVQQKMTLLSLLPLLTQPRRAEGATVTVAALNTPTPVNFTDHAGQPINNARPVIGDRNQQLDTILPLLLVGGMGSVPGSDGSSSSDNTLMLLALALAFARPPF
jgi:hypothetical protein